MRELEIVRAIDTLEEELLDMMNSNSPGGDSCYIRLVLKRPSTVHVTPSEYHSQLKDYFSQQLPSHNLHTGTGMTMDRGHDNNTDDIIITIVTK